MIVESEILHCLVPRTWFWLVLTWWIYIVTNKKMKCCSLSIQRKTTKGAWVRGRTVFNFVADLYLLMASKIMNSKRVRNKDNVTSFRAWWSSIPEICHSAQNPFVVYFEKGFFLTDFGCVFVLSGEPVALLYQNVLVLVLTLRSFQFFNFFVCFKACQVV